MLMIRRRWVVLVGGAIATLLIILGFGLSNVTNPASSQTSSLLVGAAASLQGAIEAIDPLFEQADRGVAVNYTFAASGALQQQIQQGAPVDVFISAASRQMDALQNQNLLVNDTRCTLLTNRLVLVVPSNSTLGLTSFRQLTGANIRRIAIGEPRSVPVGQYAEELFRNLGILEQVRPKFVLGNSVRSVLAAVESGNAEAGLVYTTDAQISDRVRQVATAPADLHSPIVYPAAVIRASRNSAVARRYVQLLQSSEARTVFRRFGFGIA